MKQKTIVLFLSASLLLVGCGSSSNGIIPSGAKEVDSATAIKGLQDLPAAMTSSDALGLSIENANLSLSADITGGSQSTVNSSVTTSISRYVVDVAAKDCSLAVKGKGLTSKKVSDVGAEASMSGTLKGSVNIPSVANSGVNTSLSFDFSNMKAAAYIKDATAYADLSSESFCNFANTISSTLSSFAGKSLGTVSEGKYLIASNLFTEDGLPLMDSIKGTVSSVITSVSSVFTSYSDFIKSYSYDNGNYALGLTITKDNLLAFIGKATSSSSSSASSNAQVQDIFASFLNISSFEMALVYGKEGLVSYEEKIDISVDTTLGDISDKLLSSSAINSSEAIPEAYRSAKEQFALKSNCKINFLTGDNVKINYPSDLASYTKFGEGGGTGSSSSSSEGTGGTTVE